MTCVLNLWLPLLAIVPIIMCPGPRRVTNNFVPSTLHGMVAAITEYTQSGDCRLLANISNFLGPNSTRFARCHFSDHKSLDFQGLPLPMAIEMDFPATYKQQVR
jgi:hypothetical protein